MDESNGWGTSTFELNSLAYSGAALSSSGDLELDEQATAATDSARYHKVSLLGEGGMGRVWLGYDAVLGRNIAIKEPLGGGDSLAAKLLMREAMLTAKLAHPGVVAIYDVYQEAGRDLFVMALVRGRTLYDELADARESGVDARSRYLRSVLELCEVVGHAHENHVVHRDLSLRNILFGARGEMRVIDWGLAADVHVAGAPGGRVGTPGFTAPELERGEGCSFGADVWSIGAIMHAILYGRAPRGSIEQGAHPELDAIIATALHDDPERRYPSAAAMASDLRRWFDGRVVDAFEPTPTYLLARFIRRYRAQLLLIIAVFCVLAAALGWGYLSTKQEAERANRAALSASIAREEADERAREIGAMLAEQYVGEVARALEIGDTHAARRAAEDALALVDEPRSRGVMMRTSALPEFELIERRELPKCGERWVPSQRHDVLACVQTRSSLDMYVGGEFAWSWEPLFATPDAANAPRFVDGKLHAQDHFSRPFARDVVSGDAVRLSDQRTEFVASFGGVRTYDTRTKIVGLESYSAICETSIYAVQRGHGDVHWVLCSDGGGLWRFEGGEREEVEVAILDAAVSIFVDRQGDVWVMDTRGNIFSPARPTRSVNMGERVYSMELVSGTDFAIVVGERGAVRLFDTNTVEWVASLPVRASRVRVSHDGREIITVDGRVLERWKIPTPVALRRYTTAHGISHLDWSFDGQRLAIVDGGKFGHIVRPFEHKSARRAVVSLKVPKQVRPSRVHGDFLMSSASGLDVMHMYERDGVVAWDIAFRADRTAKRLVELHDGRVAYLDYHSGVTIQDADSVRFDRFLWEYEFLDLLISPTRRDLLALGEQGVFWVRDGGVVEHVRVDYPVYRAAISADGALALAGRDQLEVRAVQGDVLVYGHPTSRILSMVWRERGNMLITGHLDGSVSVWDAGSGEVLAEINAHTNRVANIALSPDERWVATGSWDGSSVLIDLDELDRLLGP